MAHILDVIVRDNPGLGQHLRVPEPDVFRATDSQSLRVGVIFLRILPLVAFYFRFVLLVVLLVLLILLILLHGCGMVSEVSGCTGHVDLKRAECRD